jgi:hypothetical protein
LMWGFSAVAPWMGVRERFWAWFGGG